MRTRRNAFIHSLSILEQLHCRRARNTKLLYQLLQLIHINLCKLDVLVVVSIRLSRITLLLAKCPQGLVPLGSFAQDDYSG